MRYDIHFFVILLFIFLFNIYYKKNAITKKVIKFFRKRREKWGMTFIFFVILLFIFLFNIHYKKLYYKKSNKISQKEEKKAEFENVINKMGEIGEEEEEDEEENVGDSDPEFVNSIEQLTYLITKVREKR